MKFWFDINTPKQVNFFKPVVDELRKRKHDVLCTARSFREVDELARIRNFDVKMVGRHGGESLYGKLKSSAQRVDQLTDLIHDFNPDVLVSLGSPEAARVAFGLAVTHVGFSDAPHAEAASRLSIPLMNLLLHPSIIPAREYERYGISRKNMVGYRAIDPAMWLQEGIKPLYKPEDFGIDPSKKTITFRFEESMAAYLFGTDKSISLNMLRILIQSFKDSNNILILARYPEQLPDLKKEFGSHATVVDRVVDGTSLLMISDLFIGSGGTMNWECALLGIPSISYTPMKYHINEYFIRKRLITRCRTPPSLSRFVMKMLFDEDYKTKLKRKSKMELSKMVDLKKFTVKVLESYKPRHK